MEVHHTDSELDLVKQDEVPTLWGVQQPPKVENLTGINCDKKPEGCVIVKNFGGDLTRQDD